MRVSRTSQTACASVLLAIGGFAELDAGVTSVDISPLPNACSPETKLCPVSSVAAAELADPPVEVAVGIFLNSISQIDLPANKFAFDAYVWFRWDPSAWPPPSARAQAGAPSSPAETFEIVDAVDVSQKVLFERPGYCCLQLKGERLSFWDVRDYPFDRQTLQIVVEDASFDGRAVQYVPDSPNSGVSPSLSVPGAMHGASSVREADFTYPTNFGDPDLSTGSQSAYSRLVFEVPVARDGIGVFFKLFTALFVSAGIAMLALFINATQVDPRFGLCVGGLFGIVASGYAVNSVLPDSAGLRYADMLHVAALVCVLLVVIESAFSLSLHLNRGEAGALLAKRLDRLAFFLLLGGFGLTVFVLTLQRCW